MIANRLSEVQDNPDDLINLRNKVEDFIKNLSHSNPNGLANANLGSQKKFSFGEGSQKDIDQLMSQDPSKFASNGRDYTHPVPHDYLNNKKDQFLHAINADLNYNSEKVMHESIKLRNDLDDYIKALTNHGGAEKPAQRVLPSEERIKKTIEEVFLEQKDSIIRQVQERKDQLPNVGTLEEFREFCQKRMRQDADFNDKMLFVSLFYFFLEKKGGLKTSEPA